MKLVLNKTGEVREETFRGRDYLVAPTTLMRAMNLDQGYVPEDEIRRSVPAWNGTPVTLNHPRNEAGQVVSANSPEVAEKTWLGYVFNAEPEGDKLVGESWIDIENARNIGGEAEKVLNRLQDNESLEVSTSYFGDKLPAGNYDGEKRSEVIGNIRPDHLAMLPNKTGKCSIEDGCGAAVANSDNTIRVAATTDDPRGEEQAVNVMDTARTPSYEGTETTPWSDVSKSLSSVTSALGIDVDSAEDLSENEKTQIAELTLLGNAEADSWDALYSMPVVNHETGKLNEGALDGVLSGHDVQANVSESALESAQGVSRRLLEEEYDRDLTSNKVKSAFNTLKGAFGIETAENDRDNDTMDRDDHISYLVENHGFDEDSLEGMGDTCLERTYESFAENDDEDTTENESTDEGEETQEPDTSEDQITVTESELDDMIEDRVSEALAANKEESERRELIDEITENSEDWDEEDLAETPVPVLTNIRDDVVDESGDANYTGQPGANAGSGGEDEAADFPALSASERIQEADD